MIKIQVVGHLGKDCNVNNVNGKNVINFSVAHSEKYKDHAGVEVNKTTWVSCAYWVERTGIAQYLKKGTQVFVEGQPEVQTYKAQDGSQRAELRCRVHNIQLLGSNERPGQPSQTNNTPAETALDNSYGFAPNANNPDDSDLPF